MLARSIRLVLACALSAGALLAAPLRVGVEPIAEQLSTIDSSGNPSGFAVDIMRAVAADQDLEIEFVGKPWPQLLADFRSGQIEILGAVGVTPERQAYMAYTAPHIDMRSAVFVRRDLRVPTQTRELFALRIGSTFQSLAHEYLLRHGATNLILYPALRDALAALDRGECDAVPASGIIATHFIQQDHLQHVVPSSIELADLSYQLRFGVPPNNPSLLFRLNEGLAHLRANGVYDRIHERWIGPLETRPIRWRDIWIYVVPVVFLFSVGFIAYLWQHRLMLRLTQQTQDLGHSEERLTLMLEGSGDAMWELDVATGILKRSSHWRDLAGYKNGEADVDQLLRELPHADDRPLLSSARDRLLNGDGILDVEYRVRTLQGVIRWIHARGKVTSRDPAGRALRAAGTMTDITDRKHTEENLRRSQRLLAQTQSVTQVGGWELDLATSRLFWTDETYAIHGLSPLAYQPDVETAIQFYDESSRPRLRTSFERTIATGEPYDLELGLVTADGRHLHVRTLGFAERDPQGRVAKVYGSLQDISAQKIATEERASLQIKMLEAQKLESLGVLAGGIAHDFNNILTIILANASFARLQTHHQPDLDQRLRQIGDASRRAADLCQRMLAYAGKSRLSLSSLDLSALVRDTEQLLHLSISKKTRLQLDLASGLAPVEADATQLRQVLMNLVINASESLEERAGSVRVRTGTAQLDAAAIAAMLHASDAAPGLFVTLEVTDEGCGMSAETLMKIFDPFYTTKFTGRGLGLAVVHGIFRTHKGALLVESTPGRGSSFRLHLPAAEVRVVPASSPAPASTAAPHGSGVVLVADDEIAVRDTAAAILRHYGYTPVLAADGHEALARFRAEPEIFSAVLLDLTMPGLDGAEALGAMRALRPGLRGVIMSGFGQDETLNRLRHVGPAGFLHKPFLPDELAAKLAAALNGGA